MLCLLRLFLSCLVLTGCTVYVPLQPTMPLVEESKQVEVAASLQPTARLEAVAAYSPVPHMVVMGAGTVGLLTRGEQYLRTTQGELGVGGYWKLGDNWLMSAIGGAGTAATNRRYCAWGCSQLEGKYYKVFGQVGIAWKRPFNTMGLTYRLAHLQYAQVVDDGIPVANFGTYRHELITFDRWKIGHNETWFLQSTLGVSMSNLRAPSGSQLSATASERWYAAGIASLLVSFGIVWQPPQFR